MTLESVASAPIGRADWWLLHRRIHRCALTMTDQQYDESRQQAAKDHLWMHFTRHSTYDTHDVPDDRPRRRGAHLGRQRQQVHRRARRPVRRPGRTRPHRARRGRRQAGRASWPSSRSGPTRTPARSTSPSASRGTPRRPQPRLLHHRWWRGRGDGVEAREAVLQDDRQAHQAQGDQPRHRLPRHPAGRAVDHRAAGDEGAVRAAGASTFRVPNTNFYRAPETSYRARTTSTPSASGRPTGSPRPSSSRVPTRWPRCSSSRCRTPAAASRRPPATSSGCARSATSTTCCWSPTRSSAPSVGSATCSRPSATTTSPTSSPAPRA